jgi:hypothetical protein
MSHIRAPICLVWRPRLDAISGQVNYEIIDPIADVIILKKEGARTEAHFREVVGEFATGRPIADSAARAADKGSPKKISGRNAESDAGQLRRLALTQAPHSRTTKPELRKRARHAAAKTQGSIPVLSITEKPTRETLQAMPRSLTLCCRARPLPRLRRRCVFRQTRLNSEAASRLPKAKRAGPSRRENK